MPFFSRYNPQSCETRLRGLEKALVEKVEKLRKVMATLELQIRDLLPEREGAAQTLAGRCCQIPRQMKAYDHLAMQCRLLYERMAEVNDSKACPSDLVCAVGTIVYAAEVLLDLPGSEQLVEVRRQLGLKFGEKFCKPFHDSWTRGIDQNFVALVAVYQPKRYEVFDVIERIAVENKDPVHFFPNSRILWLRPVDSRRPPDMSARVRASIYNSAGSPSLVAADLSEDGNREGSETITYRRSIVKQNLDGDETPPASRFAPPLPSHLKKRVSNSTTSLPNDTPRRSTSSSTTTTHTPVKSDECGLDATATPRLQGYPSGYDVPVTADDIAYEKLRIRLERIRRGS